MDVAAQHSWLPAAMLSPHHTAPHLPMDLTSAAFCAIVTVYYWWQNLKGIEESSDKALEVMKITTVMVVILLDLGNLLGHTRRGAFAALAVAAHAGL